MNNLSIKKKLTFFTTLAGVSLGAMHIANRVLEYISTADKLINSDITGDLAKSHIRKLVKDHLYF